MQKGDMVITDNPENNSRKIVRSYGIVQKISKNGSVIIKMADGSLINRRRNSIAVFIQPPPNWKKLFKRQSVFFQPKSQMFAHTSKTKSRHN